MGWGSETGSSGTHSVAGAVSSAFDDLEKYLWLYVNGTPLAAGSDDEVNRSASGSILEKG